MGHGQRGHRARHFVVSVISNVIDHAIRRVRTVEIIRMNNEPAEKQIVNVLLVRLVCEDCSLQEILFVGIKQTEAEKFPLKGYLAIREGDILCVPQGSSSMAKHMADLV